MAKWKVQNKRNNFVQFLRFVEGEEKTITISDWSFPKGSKYKFRCFVIIEDGEKVDKVWTVWDYESTQKLKKKLGVNYISGTKELKVTMHRDEEEEEIYFDIK